ncbi:MAG TPA: ABC transporter permease [Vicinamibacterales bacterium]|nr:ABC transporter permease [Vicinamibacterales bacterium]
MWRDFRYAARSLRHSPTFALAATLALGLAIGANATIFSLVDGLWFRPSGFTNVDRSVRIFSTTETSRQGRWSFPEYLALRDGTTSFSGVTACGRRGTFFPTESGGQELTLLNVVSLDFFEALGIVPAHGRVFGSGDEAALEIQPGVVLGHAFWRRRFGGDPAVVGRTVRIGAGTPVLVTILGVLPASFRELDAATDRDLWVPPVTWRRMGNAEDFQNRAFRWFDVVAIRRADVSVGAADAEVRALAAAFAREFPAMSAGRSARAISDFDYRTESGGTNAMALIALVLFVALITCVNVANLMLSRAASQSRELAVRVALGAGRRQLLRQTIAESALLGAAGTGAGLLVAMWLIRLLPVLVVQPPGFRSFLWFGVDGRVLAFTFVAAMAITLLAALAPAWAIARGNVGALIKTGPTMAGPGRRGGRLGSVLVVAQVAVSLALLSSAGVLARSFVETGRADLGFARRPLLTAWVASGSLPPATTELAVQRLSALPGVRAVAIAIRAPLSLSGGGLAQRVQVPGGSTPAAGESPDVKYGAVSADYFDIMGIRIAEGRAFTNDDERPGEPVVVISEQFAARFFAGHGSLGKVVRLGGPEGVEHRVVGVARNAVINRIGEAPEPYFYVPYRRGTYGELTFLLDTTRDGAVAATAVRETLKQIDPRLEPRQLVTMDQYLRFSASDYQATAVLATALGVVGLLLTAVGVYGVIAYRTTRRTREIGLRMALGATRRQVLGLVIGEGGRLVLRGLVIGLPAALLTTRLIRSLLFGVQPWDATAFGGATTLLVVTVITATLVPAWRATRVTPSMALRETR